MSNLISFSASCNEENVLAVSCNEENLLADTERMYKAFAKLPMIDISIEGRKIKF